MVIDSNAPIDPVAAVATALGVDPQSVRGDTPLTTMGWMGSAGEWLVVADHLGVRMNGEPPSDVEPATIAQLVAIVEASSSQEQ